MLSKLILSVATVPLGIFVVRRLQPAAGGKRWRAVVRLIAG